jgi:hypothetical protein
MTASITNYRTMQKVYPSAQLYHIAVEQLRV